MFSLGYFQELLHAGLLISMEKKVEKNGICIRCNERRGDRKVSQLMLWPSDFRIFEKLWKTLN